MKDSNKIEIGFLFSSRVYQSIITCIILIIIITFAASGCTLLPSGTSGTGGAAEDTQIAEETTSTEENSAETTSAGTDQETSATSEETEDSGASGGEITINVYYSNQTAEYLIGETRIISDSESKYVDAINEMMKDPTDGSLFKLIPETTTINSVTVSDGVAKVDLSQSFIDDKWPGETVDILVIYSIVNTLTEFPDVNSVEFYIDGVKLKIFGQLDVEGPLFRNNSLIKNS